MPVELSGPIPVRLPVASLEKLRKEYEVTGVAVSALIRRSVMRDYPADSFVGGDSTNPTEDTTFHRLAEPEARDD